MGNIFKSSNRPVKSESKSNHHQRLHVSLTELRSKSHVKKIKWCNVTFTDLGKEIIYFDEEVSVFNHIHYV